MSVHMRSLLTDVPPCRTREHSRNPVASDTSSAMIDTLRPPLIPSNTLSQPPQIDALLHKKQSDTHTPYPPFFSRASFSITDTLNRAPSTVELAPPSPHMDDDGVPVHGDAAVHHDMLHFATFTIDRYEPINHLRPGNASAGPLFYRRTPANELTTWNTKSFAQNKKGSGMFPEPSMAESEGFEPSSRNQRLTP